MRTRILEFNVTAKIVCRNCKGTKETFDIQRIIPCQKCPTCDYAGRETIEVPCYLGMGNAIVADWRFLEKYKEIEEQKPNDPTI